MSLKTSNFEMDPKPSYPPHPGNAGKDFYGRSLPPLPTKPYLSARKQYKVGTSFRLSRPINTPPYLEFVVVKIVKIVDVAKFNYVQSVHAQVEEGPRHLVGKDVFLKIFDSLYVNPDDLETICTLWIHLSRLTNQ